jgi:CBS domain-containing protein
LGRITRPERRVKASDIMTRNPVTVFPSDELHRAAEFMRDLRIGCIPVVRDGGVPILLGIITDRDIVTRCVASGLSPTDQVGGYMTWRTLHTVSPDTDVHEIVTRMEHAQVRRMPVVDADGALVGIVSQGDLATKLGPSEPLVVEEALERISSPRAYAGD